MYYVEFYFEFQVNLLSRLQLKSVILIWTYTADLLELFKKASQIMQSTATLLLMTSIVAITDIIIETYAHISRNFMR